MTCLGRRRLVSGPLSQSQQTSAAMVYHEKKFHPPGTAALEWWAVDSESLTLARCIVKRGPKFALHVLESDAEPVEWVSHPTPPDFGEAAIGILVDCRKQYAHLEPCPAAIDQIEREEVELPEYILLGDSAGPPEAIMHTKDPLFIVDCRHIEQGFDVMADFISFRSKVQLPPAGWEYWRTDAHQEFIRLMNELMQDLQGMIARPRFTGSQLRSL